MRLRPAEARRPVRPGARAAAARRLLLPARREDHVLLADPAPHRLRRLVDGRARPRARRALRGLRRAGRPPLPALPIQYADFAVWQRQLARRARCWTRSSPTGGRQLAGRPAAAAICPPTGRARRCRPSAAPTLPMRLAGRAAPGSSRRSAGARGRRSFMILLAGVPGAARTATPARTTRASARPSPTATGAEIEGLIGFFVNTLVLRTTCAGDPTFAELLAGCARRPSAPTPTRTCRSRSWSRSCSPSATCAARRCSRSVRAAERRRCGRWSCRGLTLRAGARSTAAPRKFDLDARPVARRRDGLLGGVLSYSTDLFDAATVERLLGHLATLLGGAVAEPGRPALGAAAARRGRARQLLASGTTTGRAGRGPPPVLPRRCSRRRRRAPPEAAAVALAAASGLTYGELDRRANRLAHHLRAPGRRPGDAGRRSAWSARSSWWWRCSACSRPAAPTCRSTPPIPPERLAFMLGTPGRRCS